MQNKNGRPWQREPPNVRAVVFDLYDTLISVNLPKYAYQLLFTKMNLDAQKYRDAYDLAMTSNHENLASLVASIGDYPHLDVDEYEELINQEVESVILYKHAKIILAKLRKHYKLGMISNVSTPYKEPFYRFGLDEYFDSVVFSCDVGMRKPNGMIYARSSQELGVGIDEMVMVGNSLKSDILGAVDCGMRAIQVIDGRKADYSTNVPRLHSLLLIPGSIHRM